MWNDFQAEWASSNWEPELSELSLQVAAQRWFNQCPPLFPPLFHTLGETQSPDIRLQTPPDCVMYNILPGVDRIWKFQNSSLKREYHGIYRKVGKFSIFYLLQDDYRLKMVEDGWRWLKYVEVISQIIRNNLLGVEATRSMQLICWWMKFGSWMFSSCCHSKSWWVIEKSLSSLVWKIVFFMTHQPFKLRSGSIKSIKLTSPFNVSLL